MPDFTVTDDTIKNIVEKFAVSKEMDNYHKMEVLDVI
jgi:hypothetical protein